MRTSFRYLVFALTLACLAANAAEPDALARQIFDATGIRGGIVVHLGCGDGQFTAALRTAAGPASAPGVALLPGCSTSASFQVQGLDRNPANVAAAREFLYKKGLYGEVSVERLDGAQMPYIDNLVNLVVAEDLNGISINEIKRVLVPNGVAYLKQDGTWQKIVKPRPPDFDDWTHYYYDSRGNAVSHDTAIAPPKRLQWVGTPRWSRHHDRMSSVSAMVSSAGRLFYIMDEGSRISILLPSHWSMIARDAFNGTVLWKKPIEKWQTQMWPLKSGPTQLARRLVGDGERVYVTLAIDAPICCLDGATGQQLQVYPSTKGAEEILLCRVAPASVPAGKQGDQATAGTEAGATVLYALVNPHVWALEDFAPKFNTGDQKRVETEFNWDRKPRELQAVDPKTGNLLWKSQPALIAPLTLATDGKRMVYYDGDKLICLDPATGKQRWASVAEPKRKLFEYNYAPRVVLQDKVVLYAGGDGAMKGVDAESGKELWAAPHSHSGYRSPEDLIVAGGLVWDAPTTGGGMSGAFCGRNPLTGEVKVEFPPDVNTYWFHHRCYIAKATDRFILTSRTGIEFVDFRAKHWEINHWVRGACLYGILPANGLVYSGPHNCACYPEAKLFGMNALAPALATPLPPTPPDEQRLERGPAYDQPLADVKPDPKDWPTYRHDPGRSGHTDQPLLDDQSTAWEFDLGGKLSAPTIAGGKVFVSQVDQHTVVALDMATGKPLWRFIAGARVDSPPTFWNGRVLFGCMDGHVYCLRASDGALAWRFRAAPLDRRNTAFEQIESVWPVHGSVLVENGIVSCVAGRSVFLDGGLRFLRLDAAAGKKLIETVYDEKDPDTGRNLQDRVKTLQMPVGLNDILSSDGKLVYLRSQKIDPATGKRVDIGPVSGNAPDQGAAQKGEGAHLFAPMGFVDESWFHRDYWVYGKSFAGGHNGYFQAAKFAPAGRLLVADDKNVYGFGRKPQYLKWTTTLEYQLFSSNKEAPDARPEAEGAGGPRKKGAAGKHIGGGDAPAVRFTDSPRLDPSGKPLTVEAWIKPSCKNGVIVTHGGGMNGFALTLQDGKPAFSVCATKDTATAASEKALDGDWHHLAGVLTDGKQLRLFVDGQLAAEKRAAGLIAKKPNLGLQIGSAANSLVTQHGAGAPYTGLIDRVAIFYGALSANEIAEHAKDATPLARSSGAVLSCSFDKADARDESGNGLHGIMSGVQIAKGKVGGALLFPKSGEGPELHPGGKEVVEIDKDAPDHHPGTAPEPLISQKGTNVQFHWTRPIPVIARAMAMAGDTLLVAGPPDLIDEEYAFERMTQRDPAILDALASQDAAINGKKDASLLAFNKAGDALPKEFELDSAPTWDGMAVAHGHIFVTTLTGKVICYGKAAK
ncbi:MAG TPA: PQQ-binding-like beta-propeller repeat protein [Planctomycetota bacterium]|jgi:outer membrane protein assembly factor BamB